MNVKEAFNDILKNKGIRQIDLASRMNVPQANISQRLSRNLKIDTLQEMANMVDYKLLLVPRSRRLQEGEYELSDKASKPLDNIEEVAYDLWLKRSELSVEEYTAELNKIWPDDSKKVSKEFERYMKWYMEEKLNK